MRRILRRVAGVSLAGATFAAVMSGAVDASAASKVGYVRFNLYGGHCSAAMNTKWSGRTAYVQGVFYKTPGVNRVCYGWVEVNSGKGWRQVSKDTATAGGSGRRTGWYWDGSGNSVKARVVLCLVDTGIQRCGHGASW